MTDDSLVHCISEIRRLVGDEDHRIILTLPKKGDRLNVAAIEHCSPVERPAKTSGSMLRLGAVAAVFAAVVLGWLLVGQDRSGTNLMAGKPRIAILPFCHSAILPFCHSAILPFDDFSAGKDKGYLSDAIAEAIITELARFSKAIELIPRCAHRMLAVFMGVWMM